MTGGLFTKKSFNYTIQAREISSKSVGERTLNIGSHFQRDLTVTGQWFTVDGTKISAIFVASTFTR